MGDADETIELTDLLQPAGEGLWRGIVGRFSLTARVGGAGVRYTRGDVDRMLPGRSDDPPGLRVSARPGSTQAMARLDPPVAVPAGQTVTVWVRWPLEVAILGVDGSEIDCLSPERGRTVFGPVDQGRVLEAVICPVLEGPRIEDEPSHVAPLRLVLANTTSELTVVRRVPIDEPHLAVFRRDGRLALGDVAVAVHDGNRAEAQVVSSSPPEGFRLVRSARRTAEAQGPVRLVWWLESTRSSVEYQL